MDFEKDRYGLPRCTLCDLREPEKPFSDKEEGLMAATSFDFPVMPSTDQGAPTLVVHEESDNSQKPPELTVSRETSVRSASPYGSPGSVNSRSTPHVHKVSSKLSKFTGESSFNASLCRSLGITRNPTNPLEVARIQGQWRLIRLRGPTLILGPFGILAWFVCSWQGSRSEGQDRAVYNSIGFIFLLIGTITLAMSLLPSDRRCVVLSMLLLGIPICLYGVGLHCLLTAEDLRMLSSGDCSYYGRSRPCWFTVVFLATNIAYGMISFLASLVLIVNMRQVRSAESRLRILWKTIGAMAFIVCLSAAARSFGSLFVGAHMEASCFVLNGLIAFASSYLSFRYRLIVFIQSWLMSRGEAATAAAALSELLGAAEPNHVLAVARRSFVSVSADLLTKDAISASCPDPDLSALTQKTHLGHADAFVSHSWHDDSDLKWNELQKWCAEFRKTHDREPRLWIDKYCIDQSNIEESLACLPIYLSGCRRFLILCGKTYLKRLWCLIEIFVFLEMGGKLENLDVHLLENVREEEREKSCSSISMKSFSSMSTLAVELLKFDALEAQCSNQDDTTRLQRVIDVAGSTKINMLVSGVLVGKLRGHA